ncbi:MAG: P-loop NTPase [Methanomassiliicoccales archaeon]|nr:MAG: P-loop NTPase [Methanomassiliicoccales archaeon]
MRQIAIYGKGGIGKSTISANLAACFAEMGKRTWYIGCDPKADGSMTLLGGRKVPTFLEQMKDGLRPKDYEVSVGYKGVRCIEVGGPMAGVGCAGRGIIVAVQALSRDHFNEEIDVIIYDVPGDVVCGGFAVPLREKYANEVYIVTSGEYLAMYAANNIARGLNNLGVNLGGLICNSREVLKEREAVEAFASHIGSRMIGFIPRDPMVRVCENKGRTVIECEPYSAQAEEYRRLSRAVWENDRFSVPSPMDPESLRQLLREVSG